MGGRPLPRVDLWRVALGAAALTIGVGTARAVPPGNPDPAFNGGQPVLLDFARSLPKRTSPFGVAFDAQGGLVVTGEATPDVGQSGLLLARLGPDGAIDTSFGSVGSVVLQLGFAIVGEPPAASGFDVAPRPGGGWLVLGVATTSTDAADRSGLVTAIDDHGSIDATFGTGGTARPHPGTPVQVFAGGRGAVAPDGSAYLSGALRVDASTTLFTVSKITPAGLPDATFGNAVGGAYVDDFAEGAPQLSSGSSVVVTPAGILVCGDTTRADGAGEVLVVRLTPAGALDPTFGGGTGVFRAAVGDPSLPLPSAQCSGLAVGPAGEIYAAGRALDGTEFFELSVTRLTPAGALDATFGMLGTSRLQVAPAGGNSTINDVVVQPDGKIVVAGSSEGVMAAAPEAVVVRFDVNGAPDPSFGDGGVVRLQYGTATFASGLVVSPDARSITVVGSTVIGSTFAGDDGRGHVTRLLLDPITTTTTTTLPTCPASPSVDGARCRLAALASAVGAAADGKLETKLLRATRGADTRLGAAASASGKAQRRKLKKALAQLRKLARQLGSKAASRGIDADARATLRADADALASEVQTLTAAPR